MLALILVLPLLIWGFAWGIVRDQDWLNPLRKKPKGHPSKWKEAGLLVWSLPLIVLAALLYPAGYVNAAAAFGMLLLGAAAWSAPHAVLDVIRAKDDEAGNATGLQFWPGRDGDFDVVECYINLALGGLLSGLGTVVFLAINEAYVLAASCAIVTAFLKPACYRLGWAIRPTPIETDKPYQDATFWGHVLYFGLMTLACGAFLYAGA